IKEIDAALSNAEIIDVIDIGKRAGDKIVFGATVELFDIAEDKEVTYQIVGELEADIKKNLISVTSPIARALIGKSVDDEVIVHAPGGDREYEIVAVSYK
ncbi:MAG: GreA/GreB family elongation factor, partial [Gammaproteobacteria bacterium]|nr:GreA/GreB family elongation factor [Gammaproteobacteria bacterium]